MNPPPTTFTVQQCRETCPIGQHGVALCTPDTCLCVVLCLPVPTACMPQQHTQHLHFRLQQTRNKNNISHPPHIQRPPPSRLPNMNIFLNPPPPLPLPILARPVAAAMHYGRHGRCSHNMVHSVANRHHIATGPCALGERHTDDGGRAAVFAVGGVFAVAPLSHAQSEAEKIHWPLQTTLPASLRQGIHPPPPRMLTRGVRTLG